MLKKLEENYDSLIGDDPSNPTNFSTFFDKYKEYLDNTCKLAVPKKTVRNIINNPWITDSIISDFDKSDYLYSNWSTDNLKILINNLNNRTRYRTGICIITGHIGLNSQQTPSQN